MTSEELLELISIDSDVCHGQPCIKGTRVLVTVVLDALAAGLSAGLSAAEIVRHHPTIDEDGVRAAAAYGAWLAKQEIHGLPAGLVKVKLDENVTSAAAATSRTLSGVVVRRRRGTCAALLE